jgi:hypothetical protein
MCAAENLPTLMTEHFLVAAAGTALRYDQPFRHWRLRDLLPTWLSHAMAHLPVPTPATLATEGRRETNNATRRFLDAAMQAEFGECATLAGAFQSPNVVRRWEQLCGVSLAGASLRIEYCQDMGGFWLEPHTDIGAKRFTLLIYLVDPPEGECWGTDLLHPDGTLAERVTGEANSGVLFIPGSDTWHGFGPRPISGVRRTLIVNYVGPEWRARHELCFPDSVIET